MPSSSQSQHEQQERDHPNVHCPKNNEVQQSPHAMRQVVSRSSNYSHNNTNNNKMMMHYHHMLLLLSRGMQRKASGYQLSSWVQLMLTLDGRDKITKVIQYVARFLAWYLVSAAAGAGLSSSSSSSPASPTSSIIAMRCQALREQLTHSRKAFRLGRSIVEFYKLLQLQETLYGFLLTHYNNHKKFYMGEQHVQEHEEELSNQKKLPPVTLPGGDPLWKVIGTMIKTIGLMGYWGADNIAYLAATSTGNPNGILDNYSSNIDTNERFKQRKQLTKAASELANRFYFFGALGGLYVSVHSYYDYLVSQQRLQQKKQDQQQQSQNSIATTTSSTTTNTNTTTTRMDKEVDLLLNIVKSTCDVLVFSNNPGIDLWIQHVGYKMYEGFHCGCGILSACIVLYNNYPNAK